MTDDPMHPETKPAIPGTASRCGARTRSGQPCRSLAVNGKARCRMHGGAKGSGGPTGPRNGNYRTGRYTKETLATLQSARRLLREGRDLAKGLPARP
jgi:hypothetical protein